MTTPIAQTSPALVIFKWHALKDRLNRYTGNKIEYARKKYNGHTVFTTEQIFSAHGAILAITTCHRLENGIQQHHHTLNIRWHS